MTLPISDEPSPWHRTTTYMPKRASLLSDATIDPFPQRVTRSASLREHHIVRGPLEPSHAQENGRRGTVPYLVHHLDSQHKGPLPPSPAHAYPATENFYESVNLKRKASHMAEKDDSNGSSPTSTGQQAEGGSGYCLCQPEPKIPRPRNAFILYRQHQQAAVVRQFPGLPNPEISKIIGEQWSKLGDEQKNRWKALAEEEKARHAQQYPDYRYQPRRNGRYSAGSSGQTGTSSTGSKVDPQGNCVKCGGKTMNPPTTPHAPFTPQGQRFQDRDRQASPPHGSNLHDPRNMMHATYHPRDPRHDPRYHPGYRQSISGLPPPPSSLEAHGHDLKRRRFDGGGIYIPTREYREPPGYAYSPRGQSYHRAEMQPHDLHAPRRALVSPPRTFYPPPPTAGLPPPKLPPIRPPQAGAPNPNLKLPPLTTPTSPPKQAVLTKPADKQSQTQKSSLEAMIMSMPVLNKIKILSTVSPSLTNPHPTSPPLGTRGAVVAIEGSDPTSIWSMTNSLATQLEKDGKFVVKVFKGPSPNALFGGSVDETSGKRASTRGMLGTADVLRLVEEWHKVSDEMKKFITTRPGAMVEDVGDSQTDSVAEKSVNDVEMRENSASTSSKPVTTIQTNAETRSSVVDVTTSTSLRQTKTPEKVTFDLPDERNGNASWAKEASTEKPTTSPTSAVSPKTLSKTSDLTITTPPVTRSVSRSEASPSTTTTAKQLDTLPPPSPANPPPSESSPEEPTPSTLKPQPKTPTSSSSPTLSSLPIPIALIPSYQLSTTDHCAIHTSISDAYSPGSHWQWVAALWRGAIGPDVTIAIRTVPSTPLPESSDTLSEPPLSDERLPGHSGHPTHHSNSIPIGARTNSLSSMALDPRSRGSTTTTSQPPLASSVQNASSSISPSKPSIPSSGPGVEMRLLDYRAVVVRTMANVPSTSTEIGEDSKQQNQNDEEKRKSDEFWEKAKRRVGFEVAEFLRR